MEKVKTKTIKGIDVYLLKGEASELKPDDYVIQGKRTALGAYYVVEEFPRFRTALSTNVNIADHASATAEWRMFKEWLKKKEMVDCALILFAHGGVVEDSFLEWERDEVASAFMASQGCDFFVKITDPVVSEVLKYAQNTDAGLSS